MSVKHATLDHRAMNLNPTLGQSLPKIKGLTSRTFALPLHSPGTGEGIEMELAIEHA